MFWSSYRSPAKRYMRQETENAIIPMSINRRNVIGEKNRDLSGKHWRIFHIGRHWIHSVGWESFHRQETVIIIRYPVRLPLWWMHWYGGWRCLGWPFIRRREYSVLQTGQPKMVQYIIRFRRTRLRMRPGM